MRPWLYFGWRIAVALGREFQGGCAGRQFVLGVSSMPGKTVWKKFQRRAVGVWMPIRLVAMLVASSRGDEGATPVRTHGRQNRS